MSEKISVTVFVNRSAGGPPSGWPHARQKRARSGFSSPPFSQRIGSRSYDFDPPRSRPTELPQRPMLAKPASAANLTAKSVAAGGGFAAAGSHADAETECGARSQTLPGGRS